MKISTHNFLSIHETEGCGNEDATYNNKPEWPLPFSSTVRNWKVLRLSLYQILRQLVKSQLSGRNKFYFGVQFIQF